MSFAKKFLEVQAHIKYESRNCEIDFRIPMLYKRRFFILFPCVKHWDFECSWCLHFKSSVKQFALKKNCLFCTQDKKYCVRLRWLVTLLHTLFVHKMKPKTPFSITTMVLVCNGHTTTSIWLHNVCGWDHSVVRGVNY